jgi:hypothetical protein
LLKALDSSLEVGGAKEEDVWANEGISALAWSLSVLDAWDLTLSIKLSDGRSLWDVLLEKLKASLERKVDAIVITSWLQALLHLEGRGENCPEREKQIIQLSEILIGGGYHEGNYADEPRPSDFQKEVYDTLSSMGLNVEQEKTLGYGGVISIDIMITLGDGKKVAVEVDGPWHFFSNDEKRPTGRALFKRTLLEDQKKKGAIDDWIYVAGGEWPRHVAGENKAKGETVRSEVCRAKLEQKGITYLKGKDEITGE